MLALIFPLWKDCFPNHNTGAAMAAIDHKPTFRAEDDDYVSPVAENVIRIMGGIEAVTLICGFKNTTAVYKWAYPRSKGGRGGRIPTEHQQTIYDEAYRRRIKLRAEDFFEDPASKFDPDCAAMDAGSAALNTSL